jgi:hypothetical protein
LLRRVVLFLSAAKKKFENFSPQQMKGKGVLDRKSGYNMGLFCDRFVWSKPSSSRNSRPFLSWKLRGQILFGAQCGTD